MLLLLMLPISVPSQPFQPLLFPLQRYSVYLHLVLQLLNVILIGQLLNFHMVRFLTTVLVEQNGVTDDSCSEIHRDTLH